MIENHQNTNYTLERKFGDFLKFVGDLILNQFQKERMFHLKKPFLFYMRFELNDVYMLQGNPIFPYKSSATPLRRLFTNINA